MAATVDTEWQERVLALKAEGMSSAEIAEAVGKHAATVRKVIARAKGDERCLRPIGETGTIRCRPRMTRSTRTRSPTSSVAEAGEAVGPMPPSRAVDPQDGLFDKVWDDPALLAAWRRVRRRAKRSSRPARRTSSRTTR
jgi:hypothetical protein